MLNEFENEKLIHSINGKTLSLSVSIELSYFNTESIRFAKFSIKYFRIHIFNGNGGRLASIE